MTSGNEQYGFKGVDERYVRELIAACDRERFEADKAKEVAEGDRLAVEFRKMFSEVSDKDIGVVLVVIARVLSNLGETTVNNVGNSIDFCIRSYSHAASSMFKTVIDLKDI